MEYDRATIVSKLESALKETEWVSNDVPHNVAFHMTDWLDDLQQLQSFYSAPESYSQSEITDLLMSFLVHVPSHLAAASKLFTGEPVGDLFGIGATTGARS